MIIDILAIIGVLSIVVYIYNKRHDQNLDEFIDLKEFRESKINELIEIIYQTNYVTAWNEWIKAAKKLITVKELGDVQQIKSEEKMVRFHKIRMEELTKMRKKLLQTEELAMKDKYNVKDTQAIKEALVGD